MSTKENRGIKRKRDIEAFNPSKNVKKSHVTRESPQSKFNTKLFHGIKEVKKASKIAKTREIQRLVKRLKDVSQDGQNDAKKETERELEELKHLNSEGIACNMLLRRLQKDKHIQENTAVKAAIANQLPQAAFESTLSVVEARFRSSKVLATEIGNQVNALRSLVIPEPGPNAEKDRHAEGDGEAHGEAHEEMESDSKSEADDGWESGSIPDPDDATMKVNSYRPKDKSTLISAATKSKLARKASSTATGNKDSDIEQTQKTGTESSLDEAMDKDESERGIRSSSFLPSLSVGYIRGDSDASDWDDDVGEKDVDMTPRKNRRGQRARKAIWEKKYGRNANHLKKQRELGGSDNFKKQSYSNFKAGGFRPKPRSEALKGPKLPKKTTSITQRLTQTSASTGSRSKGKEEKPLHPSWEAARRQKSQPMVVPSAGKKIVF